MSVLINEVRIKGFRGIANMEVSLGENIILTGMNNSGKTSFLKSLQLVFGNRLFLSHDDFYIDGNNALGKIVIDVLIVPVDENGNRQEDFSEDWEILLTTDRIQIDSSIGSFVPLRTEAKYDEVKNNFRVQQYIMSEWPPFKNGNDNWFDADNGNRLHFSFEEIPFFYVGAQRDILEDIKLRNSYLGKMISKIEYSPEDIEQLEAQINEINENAVNSSEILSDIKKTLIELDVAMGSQSEGVEITPFTKKLRDLNKGLTIYYSDKKDSFSMEYHGMGTRSWSSLLTLKAFLALLKKKADADGSVFFPILAIEEPEAHLHPNAQKKLYVQIDSMSGQKVVSTHSPYIAASANVDQIRSFYKENRVLCGQVDVANLNSEDCRKITRQVIATRGEIFFSRAIVFFEGETEEQALPIFFEKYFGVSPVEYGVDFVGVGGHGNYLPFIRFSDSLNIPWLILSDAEEGPKNSVLNQLLESGTHKTEEEAIVFLDDGNKLEKQLITDGFQDEIKAAIVSQGGYHSGEHKTAKIVEIKGYGEPQLLDIITNAKTKYAVPIAEEIVKSEKELPAKIVTLFEKLKGLIVKEREDNGQ